LITDQDSEPDELDIRALLSPLRRRWWLVLGLVVVVTAAAYLIDARRPKVYQAATSIYVDTSDNPVGQFQGSQVVLPSNDAVADLTRLAQSTAVGVQLKQALHSPQSPDALLSQVTATPDATADFVDITATGATGALAAALANAYAQSFVAVGTQQVTSQLAQLEQTSEAQLAALTGRGPAVVAQRQSLQSRIAQLKATAANVTGPEQQTEPAVAPLVPISPRPKRVAALALFVALLNAIIIVYLIERLDRRVKQLDGLASSYDLPLLGVVPHVQQPALVVDDRAALDADLVESLRFLRVNLSLQSLDRPIKLLLVTSALPGEGKSTVVRNLALACREAGVDVVVVDADLRRPSLSDALGWNGRSGGLTGILVGDEDVAAAVGRADVHLPGLADSGEQGGPASTIGFLPSGGVAANPPAILGSARMAELLQELAASAELVIIDSPPLLAVSDTLPLLSIVDGVVMVARLGYTTRDAIRRAKATLRATPTARIFGVVAEDAKVSTADYGYSKYGYDDSTRRSPEEPPTRGAPAAPVEEPAELAAQGSAELAASPVVSTTGTAGRRAVALRRTQAAHSAAGAPPAADRPSVGSPAALVMAPRSVPARAVEPAGSVAPSDAATGGAARRRRASTPAIPALPPAAVLGPPRGRRGPAPRRRIVVAAVGLIVVAAAVAAVLVLGGTGSSAPPVRRPAAPISSASTTTKPPAIAPSEVHPYRSAFEVAGLRIAVFPNPRQRWTRFADHVSPGAGMSWELVSLSVRNLRRSRFDPRVLHYRLLAPNGQAYFPNPSFGTTPDVGKPPQPIALQGLSQVELAFQVPTSAAGLELAFDPAGRPDRVLVSLS
jgi:capsular exopolysaccharide synthesis family protein